MSSKQSKVQWQWFWYEDEDGPNTCINCTYPAYKVWDHRYSGYRGICTRCEVSWPES